MKIRKGFVLREIENSVVVVPTGDLVNEFNIMINLNKTGKFIWQLLEQEDISSEEIAKRLASKYKIDENLAMSDTQRFVEKLKSAKIII